MTYRYLYILFLVLFTLSGCISNNRSVKDSIDSKRTHEFVSDSLVAHREVYLKDDTTKQAMTINLFMEYPIKSSDSIDCEKIQHLISYLFLDYDTLNNSKALSPYNAFNLLLNKYEKEAYEYANAWNLNEEPLVDFSEYYKDISTRIDSVLYPFMIVSTSHASYLGGAHGGYNVSYDNIDLKDYEIIDEKKIFKDNYEKPLALLIQQQITERNKSEDEDNHINLLLELDEVRPNNNFYFSRKGLVYVYNQYDITAYVYGVIEILVPYGEILSLIKDKYIPFVKNIQNMNDI